MSVPQKRVCTMTTSFLTQRLRKKMENVSPFSSAQIFWDNELITDFVNYTVFFICCCCVY